MKIWPTRIVHGSMPPVHQVSGLPIMLSHASQQKPSPSFTLSLNWTSNFSEDVFISQMQAALAVWMSLYISSVWVAMLSSCSSHNLELFARESRFLYNLWSYLKMTGSYFRFPSAISNTVDFATIHTT